MKSIAIVILVTLLVGCGMTDSEVKIKVQRFEDGPIIPPLLSKEIGTNASFLF